jgi:hypothetical protein
MLLMDGKAPDAVACLFLVKQLNNGNLLLKMLALTASEASLPDARPPRTPPKPAMNARNGMPATPSAAACSKEPAKGAGRSKEPQRSSD